jgi:hypothetical protein
MKTIRYYDKNDQYYGWNKLTLEHIHNDCRGWLRNNGFYVIVGDTRYNNVSDLLKLGVK